MRFLHKFVSWEFLRYVVVGGGTNIALIVMFVLLVHLLPSVWPVSLNVAASLLILPFSYALNRLWVFRSDAPMRPQFRRFLVAYLAGLTLATAVFTILLILVPLPVLIIQATSVVVVVSVIFLVQALWTFASPTVENS